MYDAIVIGAGVVGCSIARYLSRYAGCFAVIEQAGDVCDGASKANSAIAHAGFDAPTGSFKARMNLRGSQLLPTLAGELDFPYLRNGSLVVRRAEQPRRALTDLLDRGLCNGVKGLELLSGEALTAMEPNLAEGVVEALYAPSGGILCPFGLTIAMAENACANGVAFYLNTQVRSVRRQEGAFTVETSGGVFLTRAVINAAGVSSGRIHNMLCSSKLRIIPRKGEYYLLDRQAGAHVQRTIFQLPTRLGKGVLVSPTVHGNLIVGPTAQDVEDGASINTTRAGLDLIRSQSALSVGAVPFGDAITSFAGIRAHEAGDEFILGEAEDCPGFFDAAGVESPGLTSAPAIGEYLAGLAAGRLELRERPDFIPRRQGPVRPDRLSFADYNALIQRDPAYGRIVCRCEQVTEGEVRDAIRRPLGARDLDAVKRRTRAGMGRCQAGFCSPRVMAILAQELGLSETEITKNGGDSRLLTGVLRPAGKGGVRCEGA